MPSLAYLNERAFMSIPIGGVCLSLPDKPFIGTYRADSAMGNIQSSGRMSSHGGGEMSSHDCECPAQSWGIEYTIIDGNFQLLVIGRMF